ncbi:MAG: sn-glycerol-3-phosphate ABC transporter ATP-binding protein UgpC [Opitutales bacterium]|nr:sn-glycerol-3-phosphate ABC transporter ATP-binding protein UgpC [Opitutales bacterium]
MATVTLRDLVKVYPASGKNPPFEAVKKINLEIKDREFMVLVGPSGCGKSTTLRMIAGLEEITGGEVSIGDRVVNNVLPKNRDIAMVFQNYALYPHMTVYNNMAFGLKLKKVPKDEIKQRVEAAAAILGIESLLDRKPKALSGGQRQRVAVGRAIVRDPKVFLFDEPLSNLDAKMRVSMRTEISRLHNQLNATMIYVTHDQVEAMTMGDRICVMKDGVIMQVDEPLTLYKQPLNMFVAGFIGSPPMNFIHGRLESDGEKVLFIETNDKGKPIRFHLSPELASRAKAWVGKAIVFGIRPEEIGDARVAREGDYSDPVEALVDVSEPMGSETFLYLDSGASRFIAKVRSFDRYTAQEPVQLIFNLETAHLFDPETQDVIQ